MAENIAIDFVGTNIGSGSKTYSINFCNQLNSLKLKNKIKIFICKSYYSQVSKKIRQNKKIEFIIKPNFLSIGLIRVFWIQFILPFELKLLGINKLYSSLNYCPILSHFLKIKVVLCSHSNLPWIHFNMMPGNLIKNFLIKKIMEYSILNCNILIVNSFFAKKEIIKLLNIKKKKIEVVYLGINKETKLNSKILKKINNFNLNNKYILSVTSCVKYHKIINVLKGYKGLINEVNFRISLVLVMQILDREYFKEIKKFIQKNFQNNEIIILNDLNKEQLANLYKKAKVYIFSSTCEVFGLTTLEAMSYKIPLTISNRSALPEINNSAALYFNPDKVKEITNSLKEILLNKKKRIKLIKESKKNLKRFSLHEGVKRTLEILENLN
jgi:glycosyltransferase involved in cell wall biosynthesis